LAKEGPKVDFGVLEELLSVFMELILANLVFHFEDLSVKHGFSTLPEEFFDDVCVVVHELLVYGEMFVVHIYIYDYISIKTMVYSKG
jgi:hypothetical protein